MGKYEKRASEKLGWIMFEKKMPHGNNRQGNLKNSRSDKVHNLPDFSKLDLVRVFAAPCFLLLS